MQQIRGQTEGYVTNNRHKLRSRQSPQESVTNDYNTRAALFPQRDELGVRERSIQEGVVSWQKFDCKKGSLSRMPCVGSSARFRRKTSLRK